MSHLSAQDLPTRRHSSTESPAIQALREATERISRAFEELCRCQGEDQCDVTLRLWQLYLDSDGAVLQRSADPTPVVAPMTSPRNTTPAPLRYGFVGRGLTVLGLHRTQLLSFLLVHPGGCSTFNCPSGFRKNSSLVLADPNTGEKYYYGIRRALYLLHHGTIPENYQVRRPRTCSRNCVDPYHLELFPCPKASGCALPLCFREGTRATQPTLPATEVETRIQPMIHVSAAFLDDPVDDPFAATPIETPAPPEQPTMPSGLTPKEQADYVAILALREFIEGRLDRTHSNGCWVWSGHISGKRPMICRTDRRKYAIMACRALWVIHRGYVTKGTRFRRTCSTDHCVRPECQSIIGSPRVGPPVRRSRAKVRPLLTITATRLPEVAAPVAVEAPVAAPIAVEAPIVCEPPIAIERRPSARQDLWSSFRRRIKTLVKR